MVEVWTPDWSNAVFSIDERDRRWANVRKLMSRDGIDVIACLHCTSGHDRGDADARYLTQLGENCEEAVVYFPVEGDVTAWHTRPGVWPSSNWFTDIRRAQRGASGGAITDRLHEANFSDGTIAIAGLTSSDFAHTRAAEGEVNWASVEMVKAAFPNAKIVSATPILGEARYVKSEEEIDFLRRGAEVAERTIQATRQYARAGVPEREVFAEMLRANAAAGGSFPPMFGWISGPLNHPYHRIEQPSFRRFQTGDVLVNEVEGRWGGYIAQLDQTYSIGPAPQDLRDGMNLAIESFNQALEVMKPGVTFRELTHAGDVKGMGGRGMARLHMHGRGTGDEGPQITGHETEETLAVELKVGVSFAVKPSVFVDGKSDYGRWGDTVVVREHGAERLGTRTQELYELI
ncbi:MAG: hypothetical protein HW416_2767 [Chloroflexi bacterium]|nr:hypothetical protein [Chloroflexota bacterium]